MSYNELVQKYRNRKKDLSLDAVATGISFVDNALVDLGVLDGADGVADALGVLSTAIPLATIAVTEGTRVLTGKKTSAAAGQDAIFRTVRTGLAMGAGAVAAGAGLGAIPAIPISIGVRIALDRYRSRAMTGVRLQQRIVRLRALRENRRPLDQPLTGLMASNAR